MKDEQDTERDVARMVRFLREQFDGPIDELPRGVMKMRVRPSPPRIAVLAMAAAIVSAGIWYLAQHHADQRTAPPLERPSPAVVIRAEDAADARGERIRVGAPVREGADLVVGEDGILVIRFEPGAVVRLGQSGRMRIEDTRRQYRRLWLEEGTLDIDLPEVEGTGSIEVAGRNAAVRATSTRFGVRARAGMLEETWVERGGVTVTFVDRAGVRRLAAGERIVLGGDPEQPEHDGAEQPDADVDGDTDAAGAANGAAGVLDEIRAALKQGNVHWAVALAEKHAPAHGHRAEFLLLAADAHRRAGMHEKAVSLYLEAADKGKGKRTEVALVRAAELQLRKLGDANAAIETLERYFSLFPSGKLEDEALVLLARAHISLGDHGQALAALEAYLGRFPDGSRAAWAHLKAGWILSHHLASCNRARPHLEKAAQSSNAKTAESAQRLIESCAAKEVP